MSWMLVAAGAGATAGAVSGYEKKKDQKRQQKAQAEMTRYSPWTGMQGQIVPAAPSMFTSMLGGASGVMGLAKGLGAGGGGDTSKLTDTDVSNQTSAKSRWENMFNPESVRLDV